MRRRLLYACALVRSSRCRRSPPPSRRHRGHRPSSRAVVAAGLMAREAAARPNDPLTRGRARDDRRRHLAPRSGPSRRHPTAPVTMAALDARLVGALGLTEPAKLFTQGAKTPVSLLRPGSGPKPSPACSGLRTNHPAGQDASSSRPASRRRAPRPPTPQHGSCASANGTRRVSRSSQRVVRPARADALAEADPQDRRAIHRLPVRLGRRERDQSQSPSDRRCTAASTAPASSGASTRCRRTRTRARSPTCSRAGRPMR